MAAKEAIARLLRPPQERIVLLGDPAMRNYEQREMGSLKCSSKSASLQPPNECNDYMHALSENIRLLSNSRSVIWPTSTICCD